MNQIINILAIESSCDETSAAIIQDGKILSNVIASQKVHESYGGVVPELASRAHEKVIVSIVQESLINANISKNELTAIAVTQGPGLLGSLLVGGCFAKSISYAYHIPLIQVNHMEAHIYANFIESPVPEFPFLCLTVSGGHTQIIMVNNYFELELLGETQDDAVGEAFDKIAKLLGLPYPGGPLLDKLAKTGSPSAFEFPIAEMKNYDFSFSGIKTFVSNFVDKNIKKDNEFVKNNLNDLCASIQNVLIETLMLKLIKASKNTNIKNIAIAGGVAANSELRKRIIENEATLGWKTYIPKFEYCTDNAAMIAITAYLKYKLGKTQSNYEVPNPRMQL
ncbi:MAG: tRNA (adenosine(37)-N6)-threonylcarbamoyltransferase complex transferase subunit TsaD [Bacteroidota bacterium]|nr:tRNA (adenosine(37)-N6)-threonylcarbamoyltransferase complex transferase subunit TsaD [Bacteroidota bacterium]